MLSEKLLKNKNFQCLHLLSVVGVVGTGVVVAARKVK